MRTLPCIDPWGKFEEILLLPDDGLIEVIFRYRKKKIVRRIGSSAGGYVPRPFNNIARSGQIAFSGTRNSCNISTQMQYRPVVYCFLGDARWFNWERRRVNYAETTGEYLKDNQLAYCAVVAVFFSCRPLLS